MKQGLAAALAVLLAVAMMTACDSGGAEGAYQKVFKEQNSEWELFEVKKEGDMTILRVEVTDVVPFDAAKKAMEALQKQDPKLKGYIEFYNSEVGMVLRKVEIVPLT